MSFYATVAHPKPNLDRAPVVPPFMHARATLTRHTPNLLAIPRALLNTDLVCHPNPFFTPDWVDARSAAAAANVGVAGTAD
jgi:hypothetical protein